MYKLCKTEQSALRQRELEEGLLKTMSVHHYDDISVSDLCQQMDIPRKSFYRYFSSKDGALFALIEKTVNGEYVCKSEDVREIAFYKTGVTL